jgi:SsrA-binding protein
MDSLAENRKAKFEYDVLDTIEAGLVLTGQEAKSTKNGGMNLSGAFVVFHNGEAQLLNATIAPYSKAGPLPEYDPSRSRRVLLHKKQIHILQSKAHEEGLTIVPLRVYTKGRFIKILVALARGRKQFDKRAAIKKREFKREAQNLSRL